MKIKRELSEVSISFRYENEYNLLIVIRVIKIVANIFIYLIFGIYYIIPFLQKKDFSLYYNTINLPQTEPIYLDKKKGAFALGLECDNDPNAVELGNLLLLNVKYYNKRKNERGKYDENNPKIINYNNCNYEEFYRGFSNSKYSQYSQYLKDNKILKCLDSINEPIIGSYGDEIFNYYEISLSSKKKSREFIKKIDEYLFKHVCKLELHYTDITNDFNDHKKPIKFFKNEVFLQLNAEFYLTMNTFFMNQYFINDDDLFLAFKDDEYKTTSFSGSEHYFLYKGNYSENITNYAKIYLRADNKKVEIKRKYKTIYEFYADTFIFWEMIFCIINILFNLYNNLYAYHSIEKKCFPKEKIKRNIEISKTKIKNKKIFKTKTQIKPLKKKTPVEIENIKTKQQLTTRDSMMKFDNDEKQKKRG